MRLIPQLNQYKCQFCHSGCDKPKKASAKEYGKYARWQTCWKCDVSFAVGPYMTVKAIRFWQKDPDHPGNKYQVVVDYKTNQTTIAYFEEDKYPPLSFYNYYRKQKHYIYKQLLKLPRAIKTFTPKNLQEKINLYLLFS